MVKKNENLKKPTQYEEATRKKNERFPSSNEVEKKDKWVRRNVHFHENDDVEQISKEQDDKRWQRLLLKRSMMEIYGKS